MFAAYAFDHLALGWRCRFVRLILRRIQSPQLRGCDRKLVTANHVTCNFISGKWVPAGGAKFQSTDPYNGEEIWQGNNSNASDVDNAVLAARAAAAEWAATSFEERAEILHRYSRLIEDDKPQLAELIGREAGKPVWESTGEVGAMVAKVAISIKAHEERCGTSVRPAGDAKNVTRFKPHGVVAVFGPFNFPGHLPNGHIVPALLAGNTVVFKPSEVTPAVGQRLVELLEQSGLPAGVVNLVQGNRDTGVALASHESIDGIFFTGSSAAGKAIHKSYGGRPEKILALEMGGNNPLIVHDFDDIEAAVYWTIQSAFITAGQRCVCARRLIVTDKAQQTDFLDRLVATIPAIQCGHFRDDPQPFIGPVISAAAADKILAEQKELIARGAIPLVESKGSDESPAIVTPGLIDVTSVDDISDEEIFGPLLQLYRVDDLHAAIESANNTKYGLAAGIFCKSQEDYDEFFRRSRAGIVNWNKPTTGASSAAPFGGVGQSGNHNPSAYFAADYCSYPVASMESDQLTMPESHSPGLKI